MPKTLSLKKAGSQKNQKAITHFFKTANSHSSQERQSSLKEQDDEDDVLVNSSHKRKVSIKLDCMDVSTGSASMTTSALDKEINVLHIPKKFKSSCDFTNKSLTKMVVKDKKKSPQKENEFAILNSPNKIDKLEIDDFDKKEDKSPLTPMTLNYVEIPDNERVTYKSIQNTNHLTNDNEDMKTNSPLKIPSTSKDKTIVIKKSPKTGATNSPTINTLRTPQKIMKKELLSAYDDLSPSKRGSTEKAVRTLDYTQAINNVFDEEWDIENIDDRNEDIPDDINFSKMQRCQVMSVKNHTSKLELRLKNTDHQLGTCYIEGSWLDTPLSPGEIISVLATRNPSGKFTVNNSSGLLVLRPDHLVPSTSVVAGVFCKRKAVLQERFKGIDGGNTAMTIGILVHELVQKALTERIMDAKRLHEESDNIIKKSAYILYDAELSVEETRMNMENYIGPLGEFMQTYLSEMPQANMLRQKGKWQGHIDKVLDIEENVCCPQLGLKGKIDATLEVTIHEHNGHRRDIIPLELKSGKASSSVEHRGQLAMYGMMLSLQRGGDPCRDEQRTLLLYLKDRVDLHEVTCGYPERRDLVMLRNQLVENLAAGPQDIDPEQVIDIEEASNVLQQRLPKPINRETACGKCPYLTLCSLHLWHTEGPKVPETHPLSRIRNQALGHLSTEHIKYFLHWTALLKLEEKGQMITSPLHALWTDSVAKRSKRGSCAANLTIQSVKQCGDRYIHIFKRQNVNQEDFSGENNSKGPQEGEFSIVSVDNRPWIAAGVVTVSNEKQIHILLERNLSSRLSNDTLFHIDTYESYATTVQNLTNLGVLMEDSDRAERLRKLIIDKEPPKFIEKQSREVARLGIKLMRSLNIEQQRAVLRTLAAKDYALLQGLPGTGKTQTISVLIQMLVGLKQRVLVTAHTHSAVDTVLSRLPESLRVMRLGSSSRVASSLLKRCEQQLVANCETPQQLAQVYDSMEVVGVTCLGAAHALLARAPFDVCVVDEATQVVQCTALRPLFAARRFVLAGDPAQLPPLVRSRQARRLGMEESLFHRLMDQGATSTLHLQYRMNQTLVDIANRIAYNNRLKCADQKVAQAKLNLNIQKMSHVPASSTFIMKACSTELEHAALFIDMESIEQKLCDNGNKSLINADEACVVMALTDALIDRGVRETDIGVIAPFRDQVSLLRRSLSHYVLEVSTVDQFQGRDKSVIIYSCTKHNEVDDRRVKEGEVLNDQRRLAVSVTRAKHKLIVVGNSRVLRRYTPLQRLIDACTILTLTNSDIQHLRDKYRDFIS